MSPTKTAARPQLSREVVVDLALTIAGAEGLEAVTIRRLATELSVTPMALYWHFRTKDELLAGAADRVLDGVVVPVAGRTGWVRRIHAALTALVDAMRPHPQVAPLVAQRILLHPAGLALTEMTLGALDEAGFDRQSASQIAWQALTSAITLVTGDMVDGSGCSPEDRDTDDRRKQAHIAALPPDRYPHLIAAAPEMVHCHDVEGFFGLGVDLFVAGVEGLAPRRRQR